jgi:periplasmic protein TonB
MTAAVANPNELSFRRFLVYSLILHAALVLWIALSIYLHFQGPEWGGIGGTSGSVNVKLVGPPPGLPLPTQPSFADSHAVDPTKGMYKEEPKPPVLEDALKNAQKIPEFEKYKPKPPSHPSKVFESKIPPPENAVPYGKGGSPNIPTNYATNPGGGSGPVSALGQGGGDFASRYSWYVEAVRRRIGENWLQSTIDPSVRAARTAHCVMSFRIYRDGSVKNIQLTQSSGNLSMDNSAQRALLSAVPMPALPSDYSGGYVDVTFDFDLSMNH